MFLDDDFALFENHTTGIGSKLLKGMGYEGKGLGVNGQGIVDPIKVKELPCQTRLGYVRKEVGACTKTTSEPPTTDDEKPSSVLSKSTEEVKNVDFLSVSSSHSRIFVGDVEIPITGTVTQKYRHHDYLQSVWVYHHLYCPPKQVSDLSSSNQALEMRERH